MRCTLLTQKKVTMATLLYSLWDARNPDEANVRTPYSIVSYVKTIIVGRIEFLEYSKSKNTNVEWIDKIVRKAKV